MNEEREEHVAQLAKERSVLEAEITVLEIQLTDLETDVRNQREKHRVQIDNYRIQLLVNERESCRRLTSENSLSKADANCLQQKVSSLEIESSKKDVTIKRKDNELEINRIALEENRSVIVGITQQLTRAREYLTSKRQVSS